jgi:hypothetical protein
MLNFMANHTKSENYSLYDLRRSTENSGIDLYSTIYKG